MPTQLQIRRGSTTDHNSFTGAAGELTVDTTKDTLRVHDGSTAGGFELARADGSNLNNITSNITVNGTVTADGLTSQAGANATDILTLSGSAAGRTLTVQSYDTTLGGAGFDINASASAGEITLQTNTKDRLRVEATGDISFYEDTGTTAKFFWDASTERLGLGTDSPGTKLEVNGGTSGTDVDIASFTSTSGALSIRCSNLAAGNPTWTLRSFTGEPIAFAQATEERMRISSGGHLLVGKTDQDQTNTVGFEAKDTGEIGVTTDGTAAGYFNRKTSDGDIVQFRKNNTAVGTIGAFAGDMTIGLGDHKLRFFDSSSAISPCVDAGGINDNAIDLGVTNSRFKDLYLSGGAYLGGVAAANKLDDYEEGTWTPTLTDGTTTVTQTSKLGSYVKVGNIVSVYFQIVNASVSGLSGGVKVGGLPFATGNTRGNGIVQFNNVVDGPEYYAQKSGSNAFLELKRNAKTTSETAGSMITSNFSEGVSDLFGSVTYTI